jgi:single-strand DNA-binding protein
MSVNKAILIGRLGKDPDIRATQSGSEIANLSVATVEKWKDKNSGERKEKTEWHRVTIYNDALVKVAKSYLKKGSQVYIEGAIQTRKWTDQAGAERYSTEIVLQGFSGTLAMLDAPQKDQQEMSHHNKAKADGYQAAREAQAPIELDDEIPFN